MNAPIPWSARPRSISVFAVVPFVVTLGCSGAPGGGEDVGSSESDIASATTNNETAFDYFVSQGLSDVQAAGIVGNLDQESGMDPRIEQFGGGPGRGIAQWSAGGRWDTDTDDNVVWYAHKRGESPWSLQLQLEFIWYELTTFHSYGLGTLRGARTVTEATVAFMTDFEGCGLCDESNRFTYANEALSHYGHAIIGLDGKCVDVHGADTANGTKIDLWECNGSAAQKWTHESDGSLKAVGKCLDATHSGRTDGTKIQLFTCNGTGAQVWRHQADGTLLNPESGKCLDVPGFDTTNGTQLELWDCKTTKDANQIWHLP